MEEKYCCLLKKISWLYYKQFTSHKQLIGKYIYAKFACFILLSGLGWVTQVNQCVSFEGEALVFGGNCEGDDATANSSH